MQLPDIISLSGQASLSDRLIATGDISMTRWSNFEKLEVFRKADGALTTSVKENWRDSLRYSLGLEMAMNDSFTLRGGAAFDETPVPTETMTLRIPRGDTTWLTLGGKYKVNQSWAIDAGYAFLTMDTVNFSDTREFVGQTFTATTDAKASMEAHVVSMQLTLSM